MKGIIFNLLEEVVTAHYGPDLWDEVLERAALDGAYTSLGNYPDEQFLTLIAATSSVLGQDAPTVLRWFGRRAMRLLSQRFPQFFEPHQKTPQFLQTLNNIIHPEVQKLYIGADVPVFQMEIPTADSVRLEYSSPRRLCGLAEGFLQGAARHYRQSVRVEQPQCMLAGDDRCVLVCSFAPLALDEDDATGN